MDRNEVLLVGRLSSAAEDRSLPSGDTMTKWRLLVRRRGHRRGGMVTDSIPCVTFVPEVTELVHGLRPRDPVEVRGAFRCRVFGPTAARVWAYEVEVTAARTIEPETSEAGAGAAPALVVPLQPRPVAYLAKAG